MTNAERPYHVAAIWAGARSSPQGETASGDKSSYPPQMTPGASSWLRAFHHSAPRTRVATTSKDPIIINTRRDGVALLGSMMPCLTIRHILRLIVAWQGFTQAGGWRIRCLAEPHRGSTIPDDTRPLAVMLAVTPLLAIVVISTACLKVGTSA